MHEHCMESVRGLRATRVTYRNDEALQHCNPASQRNISPRIATLRTADLLCTVYITRFCVSLQISVKFNLISVDSFSAAADVKYAIESVN